MKKIILIMHFSFFLLFQIAKAQNELYFNGTLISETVVDKGYEVIRTDGSKVKFKHHIMTFQNLQGNFFEITLTNNENSGKEPIVQMSSLADQVKLKVGKMYFFKITKKCVTLKDNFDDDFNPSDTFYSVFAIPQVECSQIILTQQNKLTNNSSTMWSSNNVEYQGHLYSIDVLSANQTRESAIKTGFPEN